MTTCRSLAEAKQWAELGNLRLVPDDLRSHAGRCDVCAAFLQTVDLARELGQQLPATALGHERHDAAKFKLMAAARQGARPTRTSGRRARLGVRLLVAAFVVTAAAAASNYVVKNVRMSRVPMSSGASEVAQSLPHLDTRRLGANLAQSLATAALASQGKFPVVTVAGTSPAAAPAAATANTANASTSVDGDALFTEAWAALQSKRPAEAAKHFDALLSSSSLDAARRNDTLYWSAQAHRQAGNAGTALQRSSQLLRQYPSSPFATDAALILGEYALANDQFDAAAQYLNKAATSARPVVRERAKRALGELVKKHVR